MLASRLEIAPSANSLTRGSAASDPLVVRAGDRRTLARRASSCPLYATRTKRRNERNDQGNGPPAVEVIGSESTSATRAVTRVTARARIDRLTRTEQPVEGEVESEASRNRRNGRLHFSRQKLIKIDPRKASIPSAREMLQVNLPMKPTGAATPFLTWVLMLVTKRRWIWGF